MRQKSNLYKAKENRFEDGLLRVDACMDRHNTPRGHQYRSWAEDLPSRYFGIPALYEEHRIMGAVCRLIASGIKPKPYESLSAFADRHKDILKPADTAGREGV